ncbi:hypothetical protein R1sor_001536 [Riccia sorocarpa]|uniref:Integrase catalytic domain-containing protein n=1 Tax=Riccia sorocarpa TaxID=122646 RepID=A0ABD3H074_9MARC
MGESFAILPEQDKLQGSVNYVTWKWLVQSIMEQEDLWELVSTKDEEEDTKDEKLKKRKQKALTILKRSVNRDIIHHLLDVKTPFECWTVLMSLYEVKNSATRWATFTDFCNLRMDAGTTIAEFMSKVRRIINQLAMNKDKPSDLMVIERVLAALPSDYDNVKRTIVLEDSVPTLEQLTGKLQLEESRGKLRAIIPSTTAANVAKSNSISIDDHLDPAVKAFFTGLTEEDLNVLPSSLSVVSALSAQIEAQWFLDSCASRHVTSNRDTLDQFKDGSMLTPVESAGGKSHKIAGSGNVIFDDGEIKTIVSDVLYMPDLQKNLLSVGQLADKNAVIVFDSQGFLVIRKGKTPLILAKGKRERSSGLYVIDVNSWSPHDTSLNRAIQANLTVLDPITRLWHSRMGHIAYSGLHYLSNSGVATGIPKIPLTDSICPDCLWGKHSRHQFPKASTTRATQVLELIHADLCGPLLVQSKGSGSYILTLTDDYSRFTWVRILRNKSDTFKHFRHFKSEMELVTGNQVKCLRSDRGGEFLSGEFINFCKDHGIRRQLTNSDTPQQNGVAERKNKTILERVRCMLLSSGLPKFLWGEAVLTACYLVNRSPTRSNLGTTPYEKLTKEKPNLSNLRVFGCTSYIHIPEDQRTKLSPRSRRCYFVGYDEQTKCMRCYDSDRQIIRISRDIIFDETKFKRDWVKKLEPLPAVDGTVDFSSPVSISGPLPTAPERQTEVCAIPAAIRADTVNEPTRLTNNEGGQSA